MDDLVNSDRRIKYAKECLNYLTNIDIRFNRNQDLFAFYNKIFSLEKNKFIKPKYDQYISLTANYDYVDPTTEDVEFIENLIYSIFPDEEIWDTHLTDVAHEFKIELQDAKISHVIIKSAFET